MKPIQFNRRQFVVASASLPLLASRAWAAPVRSLSPFAASEKAAGGRLGITVLDTRTGRTIGYRPTERFTMCSTFKLPLAAAVLAAADAGRIGLAQELRFTAADLPGHAPVTRANLSRGFMSVLALAEAAQVQSDNGAANLLLKHIGGPAALTAFFRSAGDTTSRLDRYEPALNTSHGSNSRDTTTPDAMAHLLGRIFTGPILKPASRRRLIEWAIATKTGARRIRAGLPADWRAGDKTGTWTGERDAKPFVANKYNDVAVVWRRGTVTAFIVTVFYEAPIQGGDIAPQHEAVLAQAGELAAKWITTNG
ncbi:class A beta-lactamase [soil metagenome]